MFRLIMLIFILLTTISSGYAKSEPDEQILNFESHVVINKDASMDVTENITVYANQHKIRHGLVRWLPTNYIDRSGIAHPNQYKIQQILLNNKATDFHTVNTHNQIIVYIGNRDITLVPGTYTYSIKYHVNNALNFLKDQDEIYWNMTGNHWDFPINKVQATIELPEVARLLFYSGFSGKLSAQEKDFTVNQLANNKISFTTLKTLAKGKGLTAAVSWPKGIIHKPTLISEFKIHSNHYLLLEITLFLFICYFIIWFFYMKKPKTDSD